MANITIGTNSLVNCGPVLVDGLSGTASLTNFNYTGLTRVTFGDGNYTANRIDRVMVAQNALTAPRVVTLPRANSMPPGTVLLLVDESASASGTNTLSWARSGSDTINWGAGNVVAINTPRGNARILTDGVSNWTPV
jgi:hypothetical protein